VKAEFTLTLEEYIDAHKDHLRRPDRSAAYSLAIVGLLVTGIGLLVLWAGPEGSRRDGMGIFVVGVLLLAGAPIAWITAKRRTRQADIKRLREAYERSSAEARELEVTERGWRYKSQYGETSHDWAAFGWLEETGSVLKLAAPPNIYIVPKRILGEEGGKPIEQFIQKALPPELLSERFVLKYRVSAGDYVAARLTDTWRRQRPIFSLAYLFIAICFFFFLYTAITSQELSRTLNTVMAGLILACIVVVERAYYWAQYVALREYFRDEIEMRVMDGGLLVRTSEAQTVERFCLLLKWFQSRKTFLLYTRDNRFYILPKRIFNASQLEEFQQLLTKQVSAR